MKVSIPLRRAVLKLVTLIAFLPVLATAQDASNYPNKPIRIIVASQAGGAADTVARIVGQKLTEAWGQPYVIDYKPGAGANLGTEAAARSPADGYTLLLAAAGPIAVNVSIDPKLPFDPVKDFAPVSLVVKAPLVLVAHPKVPATNLREFVAYAKANPGKVNLGHPGNGTSQHLGGVYLASAAAIDVLQVPYKGSSGVTNDLLAGVVDVQMDNMVTLMPHVKAGKIRAFGVSSLERLQALPDLPTLAEAGLPGFETGTWYGIVAPAGTPAPIVDKLSREIARIVQLPDVQQNLLNLGLQPFATTPSEYSAFIKSEIAKFAKIVKTAGVKAE